MSVTQSSVMAIRPFRGYADTGLPAGFWVFENVVVGDGSGGVAEVAVQFQAGGRSAPSLYWSLEQINVHSTDNATTRQVQMLVSNMDPIPPLGPAINLARAWALTLAITPVTSALVDRDNPAPVFLGAPRDNALESSLRIADTNTLGAVLTLHAQGYFWSPGGINSEGGIRRPADGLYQR